MPYGAWEAKVPRIGAPGTVAGVASFIVSLPIAAIVVTVAAFLLFRRVFARATARRGRAAAARGAGATARVAIAATVAVTARVKAP